MVSQFYGDDNRQAAEAAPEKYGPLVEEMDRVKRRIRHSESGSESRPTSSGEPLATSALSLPSCDQSYTRMVSQSISSTRHYPPFVCTKIKCLIDYTLNEPRYY